MTKNSGKCIFVLEDDDSQRDLMTIILEEELYIVKAFPNIANFLQGLEIATPDLIIMDVLLPDGNGIEVCQKIKKQVRIAPVPIIMMSAHRDFSKDEDICPAEAFIAKPFEIEHLIYTVQQCIFHISSQ